MSPIQQIDAEEIVYSVVEDFRSVYRALITGVVTDELSGSLDGVDLKIKPDRPDLASKTTSGGAFAVTGFAEQAFPKLSSTAYTVELVVAAGGYRDVAIPVPIPQNAVFPVPAPAIALRRNPVRLQGRVVSDTANRTPVAGARIIAVDDPASPPPAVHSLAMRSPLSLPHAAGATVQAIGMSPAGSALLTEDAPAGSTTLGLSTRAGLAAGSVIQLANPSGTNVAYAIVASPGVGSGPGSVVLRDPLNTSFFANTSTVQFVNPTAPGSPGSLAQDADAGDGVLLSSVALGATTIEIDPGTPSVEYRELGALTDAGGYYGINAVGRTPELFLEASHAGFSTQVQPWSVEYDNAVNVLDFRL